MSNLEAHTPVQYLKGVGPHIAGLLQKKSVYTAWDMLFYLPIKYIDRRKVHSIKDLPVEKGQTFLAEVESLSVKRIGRGGRRRILEMLVTDGSAYAQVSFFSFHEATLRKRFPEGTRVLFHGDIKNYRGVKTCMHPEMERWDEDADYEGKIYPFYSLTEGLYQSTVRKIFHKNLNDLLPCVEEDPRSVREEGDVKLDLKEAFLYLHKPPLDADVDELNARRSKFHQRVIYDEFFYLQLGLESKRYQAAQKVSYVFPPSQTLLPQALSELPFELTNAQKEVLQDIESDFAKGSPMNRLLQGDVGSGKTIVAFLASLQAIEAKHQVAIMAPTEILAEQHFKNFLKFEKSLNIRVELLTSSTPAKKRKDILGSLRAGHVDLLVGTHALLTSDVQFANLGFIVIDEQHRFGVMQRASLKNKSKLEEGERLPHLLVMTATPIPRTLSMTVYGDLDVSVIRELPKGRKPVTTQVVREKQRQKLYTAIQTEIENGRQAYFVYPLVAESEKMDLKDATQMCEALKKQFPKFQVGLLHGKMKSAEKETVMLAFKSGEIQILVSTTVIEVGVDVPNASVMVIEHAERFGLSQLHQLRGRVGRGSAASYCYLMASYAQSEESRFRLKAMEKTHDGFEIAEEDLKLRGPGEFLGTKQSGLPDFRLAELIRDAHLLNAAKKRAQEVLSCDKNLEKPKNQKLKSIMLTRWGQKLDLLIA